MAKAKVELRGAVSYDGRGRKFIKGRAQIIDNDADIAYFKATPEFTVTLLREVKPKVVAKPAAMAEPEVDPSAPVDEAGLSKLTKANLITLGHDRFSLDLDSEMKKADMVKHLLVAQAEDSDEDSEGDDEDEGTDE